MAHFRVFTGSPTRKEVEEDASNQTYRWRTVSSQAAPRVSGSFQTLPPATLASANRRISLLYENIIFEDNSSEEMTDESSSRDLDQPVSVERDQSTAITWLPTAEDPMHMTHLLSKSFLRSSTSVSRIVRSQIETQETQETGSYDYSDAESVARFPTFHFSLHRVTTLSALSKPVIQEQYTNQPRGPLKVTVLAAVLEVDGPDTIRVKKGIDAGKEVSILKMILGDEDGAVCKLTAWREVAESWGGSYADKSAPTVKRGDIVLLDNVLVATDVANPSLRSLTASPNLQSRLEICFRTMPDSSEDARYRPDLRLGNSDSAVRKVAAVAAWFEIMAGLR